MPPHKVAGGERPDGDAVNFPDYTATERKELFFLKPEQINSAYVRR